MSESITDIELGLDTDRNNQTSQTTQTTQTAQPNQNSWWCCRKRKYESNTEENTIHYKHSRIPTFFSSNYLCCCDFLPNKKLDYQKVRLSQKYNQVESQDELLSYEFNEHVVRNILLPYYDTRLKYITNTQICWSRAGNVAYTTSSILVGVASVLSFASGTYPSIHLNFVAGSLGLLALICKEFASYSNTLDHSKIMSINKLLNQLNINHQLSDTSEDVSTLFSSSPNHIISRISSQTQS